MKGDRRTFIVMGLLLTACSNSFNTYRDANAFDWPQRDASKGQLESIEKALAGDIPIKAVVIVQDGYLIFEKYAGEVDSNTACNIKSASKSLVSILAGIASDQRLLDTNESLGEALGLPDPSAPRVLDLLRMTGGYPESSGKFYRIVNSSDHPVAASLKTRIRDLPPDSAIYSTIGANLLGYAVAKAVDRPLQEFAEHRLFSPLGIKAAHWPKDRAGNNISGADFYITARDFSRIGHLMLQGGIVDDDTLVSPEWIRTSTSPKAKVMGMDYGYLWWIDSGSQRGNYYAAGYKGQIMYISPECRSVVVIFADFDDYRESLVLSRTLTAIVGGKQ